MKYLIAILSLVWLAACNQPEVDETMVVEAQATYGAYYVPNPFGGANRSDVFAQQAFGAAGSLGWDSLTFAPDTVFFGDTATIVRDLGTVYTTYSRYIQSTKDTIQYSIDYSLDSITWKAVTGTIDEPGDSVSTASDLFRYFRISIWPNSAEDTVVAKVGAFFTKYQIVYSVEDTISWVNDQDTLVIHVPQFAPKMTMVVAADITDYPGYDPGDFGVQVQRSIDGVTWINLSEAFTEPLVPSPTNYYTKAITDENVYLYPYFRLIALPELGAILRYRVYTIGSLDNL